MKERITNYFKGGFDKYYSKYLPDLKNIGGSEFKARCPFPNHEDQHPSFCINTGNEKYYCMVAARRAIFLIFTGRLTDWTQDAILAKSSKALRTISAYPWSSKNRRWSRLTIIPTKLAICFSKSAGWNLKTLDSVGLMERGGWIWNLKGIEPVLYRFPEVSKANEVLIVEGEKGADNLFEIGFVATTCAMGAKKWRDSYNPYLEGKNVILIPDNDNEGREHMARVGASLNGKTANLKLLQIPGLPSVHGPKISVNAGVNVHREQTVNTKIVTI